MADVAFIASHFTRTPDFPKKGINFLDFTPILRSPVGFEALITHLTHHILTTHKGVAPDVIVGLDARGFLFGPILALRLGAAFVPVRKGGKLPGAVEVVKYEKEYGFDEFEMQAGAVKPGQKVIVVDDLIATGGSASAAGQLVKKSGGETIEYVFIVGLPFLKGHEKLDAPAYSVVQEDD
ncbi:adenine phosphoribosyltransferase [Cryptotrichosporon argae]